MTTAYIPPPFETTNRAGYRTLALIVSSALFVQYLGQTILTVALPVMARSFGVAPLDMSVVLTVYLFGLATFIPLSGAVADRIGARTTFCVAMTTYAVFSVCCAQSTSLTEMACFRFLQGVSGAMMLPVARMILVMSVPKERLMSALSWMLIPATLGPALGPPIGGLIVTYWSWQRIFYVSVPISMAGAILAFLLVPDIREVTRKRFDRAGFVLTALAILCLMAGLELATRNIVSSAVCVLLLLLGALLSVVYVGHSRRHAAPILDIRLARVPTFGLSLAGGSISRLTAGALAFLLPMSMQLGLEMTPGIAGTISLASAAGAIAVRPLTSRLVSLWGFRNILLWNGALTSVVILICATFSPRWPLWSIYSVAILCGCVQSLQLLSYTTIAYADLARADVSAATSLYTTVQQITLSLGVCLAVVILSTANSLVGAGGGPMIEYSVAFVIVAIVVSSGNIVNRRFARDAGSALSGVAAKQSENG